MFTHSLHCVADPVEASECVCVRAVLGEAIDFLHNLGLVRPQSIGLWPSHTTDGGGAGGSVTGGRLPLRKWKVVFVFTAYGSFPPFSLYPLLDFYFCFIVVQTKRRYQHLICWWGSIFPFHAVETEMAVLVRVETLLGLCHMARALSQA